MSGQSSGSLVILIILGLVSWYYFNKLQQSEENYKILHYQFEKVCIDNHKMKTRIQDLELYKNDISKTFNILDKELLVINDNLRRRNGNNVNRENALGSANVSIITPELLHNLLDTSDNNTNIKYYEINEKENLNKDLQENVYRELKNNDNLQENIHRELQGDNLQENLDRELQDDNLQENIDRELQNDNLQENFNDNFNENVDNSDIELEHLNINTSNNYNQFLI